MGRRYATVDKHEGEFIIIEFENGKLAKVKKKALPLEVKEGDKIYQTKNGMWKIDKIKTKEDKERIKNLMDSLFE